MKFTFDTMSETYKPKGFKLKQTSNHNYTLSLSVSVHGNLIATIDWPGAKDVNFRHCTFAVRAGSWIHLKDGFTVPTDSAWGCVLYPLLDRINATTATFVQSFDTFGA